MRAHDSPISSPGALTQRRRGEGEESGPPMTVTSSDTSRTQQAPHIVCPEKIKTALWVLGEDR